MLRLDWNLLFTVINLLIWYAIIRKFLFKPVNTVISKREAAIQSRYDEAQKLQEEARSEKERCAVFQAEIEKEKNKVMAQAQEEARAEYDHILADAQKQADKIVETSKKEAELQKEKILSRAEQEIRSLILDTAVESMQSSGNDSDLYDEFITKAGGSAHAEQ